MSTKSDKDLTSRFGELRDRRERGAGTFHGMVAAGTARDQARRAWTRKRVTVVLATGLPLVAVLGVQMHERAREREAIELAQRASSILEWRSPTNALMHNAYADWLGATPSLSASIVDTTSLPRGGSQ